MNKKGFTLVELLAVIAILAILVIIALPNVLKLYNNAKKNTFLIEAKTIYKEASSKYITEGLKGNKVSIINSNGNKLDLNASDNIKYNIKLDSKGNVEKIKVDNGEYCISGRFKSVDQLSIDKVTEGKCEDIDAVYCSSGLTELSKGSEFVNGIYTYRYMQERDYDKSTRKYIWSDITNNGWGVVLTDKASTADIKEVPCTYIDDIPVVSMQDIYAASKATNIDLSGINTSHIINMNGLFTGSKVTSLNISDFDTSSVTTMKGMFEGTNLRTVDVSNFDTSNVTSMAYMFNGSLFNISEFNIIGLNNFNTSKVTDMSYMFTFKIFNELDLSNFNTSNVTNMHSMFSGCTIPTLKGLDKFDTSNVTNMGSMFWVLITDKLDTSNFNTSKVTDMSAMFVGLKGQIDLSNFDTSKVTNMSIMFNNAKLDTLDLSNFNTSKVEDMNNMFRYATIKNIKGLDKFDTSKVKNMSYMFFYGDFNILDLSSFVLTDNVELTRMFEETKTTVGYAKDSKTASKFNDSSVTSIPSTLTFTVK